MKNFTYIYMIIGIKWCGQVLARLKYGKARNKRFLALLLIETWNYILIKCKKEERKLCALGRICKFLNLERWRSLIKAFVESQFAYFPLVWLFCSRSSNNCINHLHKLAIHHRNIRLLAIKLYKAKNSLCSQLIIELFWEVN